MTHKHGTKLNGIRTLADLRNRCAIDGDCGIWGGGLSEGRPTVKLSNALGKSTARMGRRVSLLLSGVRLNAGHVVWQSPQCSEYLCVNPAHSAVGTRGAMLIEYERRHGWTMCGIRAVAGARLVAQNSKITAEQAQEIRVSKDPHKVISEKYGICLSQIYNIRTGLCWRGPVSVVNNSVFSWRGAS